MVNHDAGRSFLSQIENYKTTKFSVYVSQRGLCRLTGGGGGGGDIFADETELPSHKT